MMKRKSWISAIVAFVLILGMSILIQSGNEGIAATKKKTYTIGPTSKPCDKSDRFTTYNKYTKQYYAIRSYLEKLEKEGGGTLVLKKGTYTIPNTLYIPDNTIVRLSKGVVIKKGTKTGTKKFKPAATIFSFCRTRDKDKKGAISKYNGVKNAQLIGEGKPIIDLAYSEGALAVAIGHTQNIKVKGIQFKNMNTGHFIELDASKDVSITNCTFMNHKDSYSNGKEAINIDTPDKSTEGFNVIWSAQDKTPNTNVKITKCTFKDLERAIGTHKYSGGKYHTKIEITNNKISGCDNDAIRVMNWKEVTMKDNTIQNVGKRGDGKRGILVSGASKITIVNNVFNNVSRPMQFIAWKNTGNGSQYKITYNKLTAKEMEALKQNKISQTDEKFVRINSTYNEYVKDTVKVPIG